MTKDEALKLALEALENNKQTHYYCEDTWYSCPQHEDGCANDSAGDECNCGADKANAEIDQAITAIKEALAHPEQEPVIGTKTWFEDGKVVTQYLHPSDIYTAPPQQERNFCPRCGKRLGKNDWDVHTCTPPQGKE